MKRVYIMITLCLFVCSVNASVFALDDKTYYGDGTSVSWDNISPYLSPLYRNTPYINVSSGSVVQKFYFNTELFSDLGLYVYGDPLSVQFSGTVNDFKAADYGYFRTQSAGKTIKGEYRYLGYSIQGIPMTNTRFPNETTTDFSDMTLMKYSDLPDYLKEAYQVKGLNNSAYASIRHLIESEDSPIWEFENMNNGTVITLRERLRSLGLMKNGKPLLSVFEYGIIYSWAETGGILRVFYQSKTNPEVIRYATFSGPVDILFTRKAPELTSMLSVPAGQPYAVGKNTFRMPNDQSELSLQIDIRAVLQDRYAELTDFEKQYTYTRDQLKGLSLSVNDTVVADSVISQNPNDIAANGSIQNYLISASSLRPGRNTFIISGTAAAQFEGKSVTSQCTAEIYVIYEPETVQSPEPPLPTPAETTVPTAALPTPRYEISRKW